ncbi:MAG: hypothetical protein ACREVE_13545 [Gammaproteobacteria bacterium]
MFFKRKDARDEIPTLHDLVEDGSAAPQPGAPAPDEPPEAQPDRLAVTTSDPGADSRPQARSAFEATIENLVAEILNRHLHNARDEITRSVLTEVRARLRRADGGKTGKD